MEIFTLNFTLTWCIYLNLYLRGVLEFSSAGNPPHQDSKEEIFKTYKQG